MKFWRIIFLAATLAVLAPAFAQTRSNDNDKILANGNPALTESTVENVRGVFEWIFETEFNRRQSEAFRLLLIDYWQRGSRTDIAVCLDYLKLSETIAEIPAARREEARVKLRDLTLSVLNRKSDDPMARVLREVAQNAKKTKNTDEKFAVPPLPARNFPTKLVAR